MANATPAEPFLPYGRQTIDEADIAAVVEVLRSDWLTTGPMVGKFEQALAQYMEVAQAVVVSNGTAALHAAMHALDVGPGDEVIVPAITFAATANAVLYQGGTPIFADIDPDTLLIDPAAAAALVTPRTKAIVAVDYGGQPADYPALRQVTDRHGLALVADACHALGGSLHGMKVGALADLSTFSFHPVKPITTGEGGAITTPQPDLAAKMRTFRNHGITSDHRQREKAGSYFYEQVVLGFNFRLTDFQCALGLSQLRRLDEMTQRRQGIAAQYDAAFADHPLVTPLRKRNGVNHAYHLYVIQLRLDQLGVNRQEVFQALRQAGLGVNVHYIPVHWHPFYREKLGTQPGQCPRAEAAYERILSLPIFPRMTDADVARVIGTVDRCVRGFAR